MDWLEIQLYQVRMWSISYFCIAHRIKFFSFWFEMNEFHSSFLIESSRNWFDSSHFVIEAQFINLSRVKLNEIPISLICDLKLPRFLFDGGGEGGLPWFDR